MNAWTDTATAYLDAGWNPIPLCADKKGIPTGVTGYRARSVTRADIAAWSNWGTNIALRVPANVVGIDVDHYGEKAGATNIADLEAKLGKLPPTWASTSRPQTDSGIWFYRIPVGVRFPTGPCADVEFIQAHHRFAVVAPSVHGEGRAYQWFDPAGEDADRFPSPDELTDLPWAWIEHFRRTYDGTSSDAATTERIGQFIAEHTDHNWPGALDFLERWIRDDPGARHDVLVRWTPRALREAAAGFYPADKALAALQTWWEAEDAKRLRDGGRRLGADEFADVVAWAIGQVDADPAGIAELRAKVRPAPPADAEPFTGQAPEPAGDTETPRPPIPVTNWHEAFTREPADALVDRLLIPGRWTHLVAPAKTGKSTFALHVAQCLSRGYDPLTALSRERLHVVYFDGEMGELDVVERAQALELTPDQLTMLHYSDTWLPRGDTAEGGALLVSQALYYGATVAVFDGANKFLSGPEKDDGPWRDLFEYTIAPLKRHGVAVLSSHNMGLDETRGRGSTVQHDKADAMMTLHRTDQGVKIKCDRPRTSALLRGEMNLAMHGLDGDTPITYRETGHAWPAGTRDVVDAMDGLGLPVSVGRDKARAALKAAGHAFRNEVLAAAIRARKTGITPAGTGSGTGAEQHRGQFVGTGS